MPNQSKRELPMDVPSREGPCKKQCKAPTVEACGRERLTRHRNEMAGQVLVPEAWGKEDMLKDRSSLGLPASKDVIAARESLVVAGCKR